MPRRLIDEIAKLEQEENAEEQLKEEPRQVRVESLHLEPDLDRYIETLERKRLEILQQIRKLLHELREVNEKLRRARQLKRVHVLST